MSVKSCDNVNTDSARPRPSSHLAGCPSQPCWLPASRCVRIGSRCTQHLSKQAQRKSTEIVSDSLLPTPVPVSWRPGLRGKSVPRLCLPPAPRAARRPGRRPRLCAVRIARRLQRWRILRRPSQLVGMRPPSGMSSLSGPTCATPMAACSGRLAFWVRVSVSLAWCPCCAIDGNLAMPYKVLEPVGPGLQTLESEVVCKSQNHNFQIILKLEKVNKRTDIEMCTRDDETLLVWPVPIQELLLWYKSTTIGSNCT